MIDIPYARLLGLTEETSGEGAPVLVLPTGDHLMGRPGYLHGGAIGGLLEMAAIAALLAELGGETSQGKPINVTVDFMRSGRSDRETRAQGSVTRLGTRIANVEAQAWQDDRSRVIAAARMNFLIQR